MARTQSCSAHLMASIYWHLPFWPRTMLIVSRLASCIRKCQVGCATRLSMNEPQNLLEMVLKQQRQQLSSLPPPGLPEKMLRVPTFIQ
jgi:hypothetical protein